MAKRLAPTRAYCCYCKRQLRPTLPINWLSFTYDYVRPQAEGGWKKVPCCRKCNHLKDDLPMEDWFWFIGAFPRWWKALGTPAQVLAQVQAARVKMAWERAGKATT